LRSAGIFVLCDFVSGVIMALAATSGVFELASLAVVGQGSTSSRSGAHGLRQQGSVPGLKLQEQLRTRKLVACGSRRRFDGVLAVASQDGNIVRFYTISKISWNALKIFFPLLRARC